MNIFVETNFVIEVALEQQEVAACEVLLQLAAEQRVRLLVPAYSFIEPHETFTRRHIDRESLRSRMSSELAQLARSTPLTERVAASQDLRCFTSSRRVVSYSVLSTRSFTYAAA